MSIHGEQARAYVVGGLDYTLTPLMRDVLVQHLARQRRYDLAAALLTGWVEHRESGRPVLAWQRLLDRTAVSVGVAR